MLPLAVFSADLQQALAGHGMHHWYHASKSLMTYWHLQSAKEGMHAIRGQMIFALKAGPCCPLRLSGVVGATLHLPMSEASCTFSNMTASNLCCAHCCSLHQSMGRMAVVLLDEVSLGFSQLALLCTVSCMKRK